MRTVTHDLRHALRRKHSALGRRLHAGMDRLYDGILLLLQKFRLRLKIRARIGVHRTLPHVRALLHNAPRLHDDDAVSELTRKRNVVRDEEEGDPYSRRETSEVVRDHLPDGGVEPLRRLIGENPLRLPRIRHRAEHALQHAAREFVRIGMQHALRIVKAEAREQRRILRRLPRRTPRSAPHIRELPPNAVHGAECRARQLRDNAPLFAPIIATQLLPCARSHIHVTEENAPRDRRPFGQCAEERLTERRFPAAALADDRRHAPCGERDIDMIERCVRLPRIANAEIVHGKALFPRHARTSRRTSKRLRRSCPTILSALTSRTIAAPGTMMRCGACR